MKKNSAWRLLILSLFFVLLFSMTAFAGPRISKKSITMLSGREYTVKMTGVKQPVTWNSSNENVARIIRTDDRSVTFHAEQSGSARIQTKVGRRTYTCKVSVKAVPVLSQTEITLAKGANGYVSVANRTSGIKWSSSNKRIAKVYRRNSNTVRVKAVREGSTVIRAKMSLITLAFTVTVTPPAPLATGDQPTPQNPYSTYSKNGRDITVTTGALSRTYHIYMMMGQGGGYLSSQGCVSVATSIASSGFGQNHSPASVHKDGGDRSYSEKYALAKMGYSMGSAKVAPFYGKVGISIKLSAQILNDMGIRAVPVYSFSLDSAEKDIAAHLATGNPVMIKCNSRRYMGRRLAISHHAMLILGLDQEGYPILVDPLNGGVNMSGHTGNSVRFPLRTLIREFMTSPTGNTNQPYVTSTSMAGGYIKIG